MSDTSKHTDTLFSLAYAEPIRRRVEELEKVNQALVDALEASNAKFAKLATWLDRLATADEERAKDTRFQSLAEACAADARNYRNTAADIQRTVSLNDAALELVKGKA